MMAQWKRPAAVLLAAVLLELACAPGKPRAPQKTEILWDSWGVPHVYAKDTEDLFRAFGWAQMKSHGNLVLELYGQARGRAAEYWGEKWLDSDRWVRTMGVYDRARQWYELQSPEFRRYLEAFAEGMNGFAEKHPKAIEDRARRVLPVDAVDVLAHAHRVVHFYFVGSSQAVRQAESDVKPRGSNAWAIAPSRSATGHALLLINPHLAWSGAQLFYEAQLVGPGIDFYGATLVGFPVLALGFNEHLGWSHTVNTFDGADSYELTLVDGGYRFDGKTRPFEKSDQILKVRQSDGTLREEPFLVRRSVHGPVIALGEKKAVAYRVVGLGEAGMLEQWWDMCRAQSLEAFESALQRLQIPMFNVIYADRKGHILYVFNARLPRRPRGDFYYWSGIVRGDTSSLLWSGVHAYEELPRLLDPESGWIQNANDPPWTATFPSPLKHSRFPPYTAPEFMHFRAQQSASLLANDDSVTFEELVRYKHWTRMLLADRLLDDLLPAAKERGNELARTGADVLEKWDRSANADSKGAVLFERWAEQMGLGTVFFDPSRQRLRQIFTTRWRPDAPFTTPDGLRDPEHAVKVLAEVAETLKKDYGRLDVAWGQVYRLTYGGKDLPANGGPGDPAGLFRAAYFAPGEQGKFNVVGGDTFYAAVEFSTPLRARVLLAYGNSTQPDSPHKGDQLDLFAKKKMRTPWLTREAVEAHLEARQSLEP